MKLRLAMALGKTLGWITMKLGLADWLMRRYGKQLLHAAANGPQEAREYFISRASTAQGQANIAEYGVAHEYRKVLEADQEAKCTE